jgi:hypothetical protein
MSLNDGKIFSTNYKNIFILKYTYLYALNKHTMHFFFHLTGLFISLKVFLCWIGEHSGLYRGSYHISNISY